MFVYRISKKEYVADLSGIGAGLYGGRWNPKGLNLMYASGSIALASLEYLVHNYHLLSTSHVCLAKIEISETTPIASLPLDKLPEDWNLQMSQYFASQAIGREFIVKKEFYGLKVPSAIVPGEFNVLLNPQHPQHKKTKVAEIIDPFKFDNRLLNLG